MFGRKDNRKLMELQRELLAVEKEEEYEEYEEYEEESFDEFLDDPEEDIPEEAEEDFTQEYTDDGQGQYPNFANHYGRGSPKRFEDIDFFDEGDFDDGDVLYQKDYRKAVKKKKRQNFGLVILAILEIIAIAAIALWWLSWM